MPERDRKKCHMAHLVSDNGGVSPRCAAKPRKIDLHRETWTTQWDVVTCPKCLAKRPAGAKDIWS